MCLFVYFKRQNATVTAEETALLLHFSQFQFKSSAHFKGYRLIRIVHLQQAYSCRPMMCHLNSDPSVLLCFCKSDYQGRTESSRDSDGCSWTRVGFLFHLKTRGCRAGPTFRCEHLLLWLCSFYLLLSQWILHCFHSCMDKNDRLSDSNMGHPTLAPPSLDPAELSEKLEEVMRISPRVRETAVRCPGGSCSDQCSLTFLCGTWVCFLRGWGCADTSAAHLSGSNSHGFVILDFSHSGPSVCPAMCRLKSCNSS